MARVGQDDTQKGYEAAIRTACYEPGNQENDEPAVDMEEVVGESRIFADPQNQTIIFLRDIDLVRNDENHSCLEQALLGGAVIVCVWRSEEHTSELQSLMRISYAVFCLKKKKQKDIDMSTI